MKKNREYDISSVIAFAIIMFVMLLIGSLTSCNEAAPNPVTDYTVTLLTECNNCEVHFQVSDNKYFKPTEEKELEVSFTAQSGDTVKLTVINQKLGNLYYIVHNDLVVESKNTTSIYTINNPQTYFELILE